MKSILIICIGNICRSPMGEALMARALPEFSVSSAGVGALVGHSADPIAQTLMGERGLDIGTHRARQLTQELCQNSDLILTMDSDQRRHIESRYPFTRGKVFRLGEGKKIDIPDPYKLGRAAFDSALGLIDSGVQVWADRISKIK
ncbi:low molecular weight protein-tyrosine-phosphatase [Variovorax sp. Varisp41]|uniref:low molecular weight protein-tyrosine-phosphatase n=1 Tax=unclassified Variovorax TaxID=663243 RepID=UPI0039B5E166